MIVQTERLLLVPLSIRQLDLWVNDLKTLEHDLRCTYDADPLEGEFGETVKNQLKIAMEDERNYLFHSFWFVMRKKDRVVVGSADFKGAPNENGEVEIAYGLGEKYRNHGYTEETVEALCHWARKQPKVRSIIAETKDMNTSSQNVLLTCGFCKEIIENRIWWRLA